MAGGGVWVRPRDEELRELGLQSPADLPGTVLLPAGEHDANILNTSPASRAASITTITQTAQVSRVGVGRDQHGQDQQAEEQHADWISHFIETQTEILAADKIYTESGSFQRWG